MKIKLSDYPANTVISVQVETTKQLDIDFCDRPYCYVKTLDGKTTQIYASYADYCEH